MFMIFENVDNSIPQTQREGDAIEIMDGRIKRGQEVNLEDRYPSTS